MLRQPHQQEHRIARRTSLVIAAIMIICASSLSVMAQWTTPDGSGNINSTNSGNVGVGTNAPSAKLTVSSNTQAAPAAQPGTTVQIVGANSATARLVVDSFGPVASSIDMRKANNTAASPTAVGVNEILGQITWQGRGATSYNAASRAKIMASAAETYTDTAQGAFMTFSVAPIGGITSVEAMRIAANGFIGIGATNPGYRLDVQSGQINASGGLCIAGICKTDWSQVGASQWANGSGNINFTGGNVGVATTTPSTALEVGRNASGTPTGVMITGGSTVAAPVLYFNYADAGTNLKRWLLFGDINGAFNLGTQPDAGGAASSKLFISNAGNIGMGTTAPTAASGYTALSLNNSTGTLVDFMTSNVLKARLQSDGTTFYFNNLANGPIQIYTNSAERMRIAADGSVGIGTITPTEKLEINGNLKLSGTGNITAAGTIEGGNIKAKYQDVAEWVESSQDLNAGTVVILDSNNSNQVIASTSAYDSRVAGVISLQPGIALGEHAEGRVLVATTGRVKVKVDASNGPINIGDLLVTGDKTGVAMKSLPVEIGGVRIHRPGTLIGKALQPLASGTGEILVLLSLQ